MKYLSHNRSPSFGSVRLIPSHSGTKHLVDSILIGEARALADEMAAAIELDWQLLDKLAGLIRIDEARTGGPKLRGLQEELLQRIDRRKTAQARNPLYLEQCNWTGFLDSLAADAERAWTDYAHRLADDASAAFEGEAS